MKRGGFTLLEIVIVLGISAFVLGFAGLTFSGYFQRSAAQRAAQVFAQDLAAARSYAMRSREPVVIRFYESTAWYEVQTQFTLTEVARRRFTGNAADIDLSGIALDTAGDSIVFTTRGLAKFTVGGSTGTATFSSGATSYSVSFNGMGASRVDPN